MALKAVFDKAPLTTLTCQPLRAGQVRVEQESIRRLYAQVRMEQAPAFLEGTYRLGCLLGKNMQEEPVTAAIRQALQQQKENGSFALTIEETVALLRAAWALYEAETDKHVLECMLRYFAWAATQWQDMVQDEYLRAFPADMLELMENLYRVTGTKAFLKLCDLLSENAMNWSSVLTTTNFQTPAHRTVTPKEMQEGLEKENGDIGGYYTRMSLTGSGMALADGVRASMARGWLNGSASEMNAGKLGWEKLSRHHGAICGGLTDFPMLSGLSPSAGVSTIGAAAWAEAFVSAGMGAHAVWAWDALEQLVCNALPSCVKENGAEIMQRVNVLHAEYPAATQADLARLARGYAMAMHAAVTAWPDGFAVNLMIPGKYAVCDSKIILTMEEKAGRCVMKLHMKNDQKAHFHMRIPHWARTCEFMVNGSPVADRAGRLVDGCIGLERVWHDGDEITAVFEKSIVRHDGYHQGVYLTWGAELLALPAEEQWAMALCGSAKEKDGEIVAPFAPVEWKQGKEAPLDVPVLPALAGEVRQMKLVPYAQLENHIAFFPRGDKA